MYSFLQEQRLQASFLARKPVNGDGDFTFSRSTAATRVNADGNIEKETQNLLLRSNSFDTTWNLSSATISGGQSGYDGTNNAWIFTTNVAGAAIQQPFSSTGVLTFSVYAKAGSVNGMRLRIDTNSDANGYYDLVNGTAFLSAGVAASIEDVGSGWYRCSLAHNVAGPVKVQFFTTDGSTNYDNGSIYIQDAQLEQGLVARDYIETTTTAVEGGITDNVPRLDYTDSSCPALLLEPQRTNRNPYSEYFGTFWNGLGTETITSNYGVSPEGLSNATRFQATSAGRGGMYASIAVNNGTTYTLSFYAKSLSGTQKIRIGADNGCVNPQGAETFEVTTEWQKFTKTITSTQGGWNIFFDNLESGIGCTGTYLNCDMLIYGYQAEEGSYATSYIPTYGTSVTRNADNPNMQISSLVPNGFFSDTYSIMFDYKDFDRGAGSANLNYLYDTSNQVCMYIYGGTIAIHTPSGEQYISFPEADGKIAFIYDGTNLKIYKNGSQYDSTIAVSTRWENPNFYRLYALNTTSTISYNTFMLFPTAISNEEAIALTTI